MPPEALRFYVHFLVCFLMCLFLFLPPEKRKGTKRKKTACGKFSPFTVLMPPITMGAFFQKFVVAIFEKRRGVLVRICAHRNFLPPLTRPKSTVGFLQPPKGVCKSRGRICILITTKYYLIRLRVLPAQKVDFEPRIIFSPQLCETAVVHFTSS